MMRATALALLAALLAAGCSGASQGGTADAASTVEVELGSFSFAPERVEVGVGDTVTWTNGDATRHTVTAGVDGEPSGDFHLTLDGEGASDAVTFDEPGEYPYFCTPHPFMEGVVVVTAATRPAASGGHGPDDGPGDRWGPILAAGLLIAVTGGGALRELRRTR